MTDMDYEDYQEMLRDEHHLQELIKNKTTINYRIKNETDLTLSEVASIIDYVSKKSICDTLYVGWYQVGVVDYKGKQYKLEERIYDKFIKYVICEVG